MLLQNIRAAVLRLPGGHLYWQLLAPTVEEMTEAQRQALWRVLQNAETEGMAKGRRQGLRSLAETPWRRRP